MGKVVIRWTRKYIMYIICVLRPWFDCIDRHAYLLGFPLRAANGSGMDELGKVVIKVVIR